MIFYSKGVSPVKRVLCLLLCLCLLCGQVLADEPDLLKNAGDQFVKENGLSEDDFAVYFYNPDTREEYVYNENAFLPVGSDWILPLHMHYYEQETLGAFDPPIEFPDEIYTIEGKSLEQCRYHSILMGEEETALQMRDNLGTPTQYLTLINEEYGHCDPLHLPDSYFNNNCYSAKFLMNCLKQVTSYPELYQDMMKNFSLVQTDDGFAAYDRPYNLVHIRGEADGFICDVGEISGPDTYLLVCFASEEVGGDALLGKVNSLFCSYVEQINDVRQETTPVGGEHQRSDTDFQISSVNSNDKTALLRWIGIALGGAAVLAGIIALIFRLVRRRDEDNY